STTTTTTSTSTTTTSTVNVVPYEEPFEIYADGTSIAGTNGWVGDLNAELAQEGQRLPFEVRDPARATIGGSVASNAPGRRQSSTGGIRDWVLGMQIVLADGTVTKSGGRVVKNVQGYDLHRLHTGAFGTLGVIAQVAFKLAPVPPAQQTIAAWFDDVRSANEVGLQLVNGLFAPEVISLVSGPLASALVDATGEAAPGVDSGSGPGSDGDDETWMLLIRLGGGVRSVERQVNEVTGTAGAGGATGYAVLDDDSAGRVWALLDDAESAAGVAVRVSARVLDTLRIAESIRSGSPEIRGELSTVCNLGFGAMTALASTSTDEQARDFVEAVFGAASHTSGSYVVERCPLTVKQQLDVFSDVGNSIELMRRIKNQYDPANILNPGRFAGKI
ncbi:MAG: FAD-binding oxidoreductase, partial [Dehalococcoidia bacterium]|nr:FAD-binding oxidoreductase [Dehalococcoidia bacterium]